MNDLPYGHINVHLVIGGLKACIKYASFWSECITNRTISTRCSTDLIDERNFPLDYTIIFKLIMSLTKWFTKITYRKNTSINRLNIIIYELFINNIIFKKRVQLNLSIIEMNERFYSSWEDVIVLLHSTLRH